jgi:hypothetical protein
MDWTSRPLRLSTRTELHLNSAIVLATGVEDADLDIGLALRYVAL